MALSATDVQTHCDAITGTVAGSHGWEYVRCETTIGLRSFTDRSGTVRSYCGSLGHHRNVTRRFGQGDACYLCGKPTDDMAIAVNLGLDYLGLMCFRCQDDLEPLTQDYDA